MELIDLRVDKMITLGSPANGLRISYRPNPEFGWVGCGAISGSDAVIVKLLPAGQHACLPQKQLELWAQVAVRGELGEDGRFVKWEESAWEQKRQELAASLAPFPDFPFPGYLAGDRLHWLRAEYNLAATDADKQRLAKELLRRAETTGDRAEAVRWRNTLAGIETGLKSATTPVSE